MTTKIPFRSLKFGCYQISVRQLSKENAKRNWGLYWPHQHRIDFHREYPTKHRAAETFLHECVHVILEERGVSLGSKEEGAVTEFTKGLVAFFRDNPDAAKWLLKALQ